jgi:hypothetical protein
MVAVPPGGLARRPPEGAWARRSRLAITSGVSGPCGEAQPATSSLSGPCGETQPESREAQPESREAQPESREAGYVNRSSRGTTMRTYERARRSPSPADMPSVSGVAHTPSMICRGAHAPMSTIGPPTTSA